MKYCVVFFLKMKRKYQFDYKIKTISLEKARKGVIYPLKTGIYALVGISERTFTR